MKRLVPIIFFLIFVMNVGVAAADPGPKNPHRDVIVDVDCDGEEHDYEMLYTVGLSPWFDPQGTVVAPGPVKVEKEVNEDWITLFELPTQNIPTIYCEWTRGVDNFRGDVQFSPLN
jgi:hypothetical protein